MRDLDGPSDPPRHASHAAPGDALLGRALALVRFLRERCPWDARQDPLSLRPYLLEEAHEVADAITTGDEDALPGELGDLLLNVAFQIVLAEERGAFDADRVVEILEAKMRGRHPHIYGDAEEPADWEELKARERERDRVATARRDAGPDAGDISKAAAGEGAADPPPDDPFRGVPASLEPLARALRLQERVAARGFDWEDALGPLEKVREETGELADLLEAPEVPAAALQDELGDLLFAVVNLARLVDVHPSTALQAAVGKFQRRVRAVWRRAAEAGIRPEEATLEELDAIWNRVKTEER